MPALTLNGITIPVALDQWSRLEPMLIGEEGRAFSGAELNNVRAWKEGWRAQLTPQAAATAAALRGLARGEGFSWSFDSDFYADRKGLGPASGTGSIHASVGKYGGHSLSMPTALTYAVGAGSAWTLLGWQRDPAGTWQHYIRLSAGGDYKNGAATSDAIGFSISGANLVFTYLYDTTGIAAWQPTHVYSPGDQVAEGGKIFETQDTTSGSNPDEPDWASAPNPGDEVEEDGPGIWGGPWIWTNTPNVTIFDDVVFLPYLVPTSWVTQLYAEAAARAWTPLPRLRLAGDAAAGLAAGYATVTGKVMDAPLRHLTPAGSTSAVKNMETLEMELREA